jgi:pimeloyl-ACP methyl ester carboxylesterase
MPTLRTNDAELFYEEAGSGEPVLLLHGLGSSTLDWAPQIEALKGSYRVIAMDARGSGRSASHSSPRTPPRSSTHSAPRPRTSSGSRWAG